MFFGSVKGKTGTLCSGASEATGKKEKAANCFEAPAPFYANKLSLGFLCSFFMNKNEEKRPDCSEKSPRT